MPLIDVVVQQHDTNAVLFAHHVGDIAIALLAPRTPVELGNTVTETTTARCWKVIYVGRADVGGWIDVTLRRLDAAVAA
jgi:hypothetical protein